MANQSNGDDTDGASTSEAKTTAAQANVGSGAVPKDKKKKKKKKKGGEKPGEEVEEAGSAVATNASDLKVRHFVPALTFCLFKANFSAIVCITICLMFNSSYKLDPGVSSLGTGPNCIELLGTKIC